MSRAMNNNTNWNTSGNHLSNSHHRELQCLHQIAEVIHAFTRSSLAPNLLLHAVWPPRLPREEPVEARREGVEVGGAERIAMRRPWLERGYLWYLTQVPSTLRVLLRYVGFVSVVLIPFSLIQLRYRSEHADAWTIVAIVLGSACLTLACWLGGSCIVYGWCGRLYPPATSHNAPQVVPHAPDLEDPRDANEVNMHNTNSMSSADHGGVIDFSFERLERQSALVSTAALFQHPVHEMLQIMDAFQGYELSGSEKADDDYGDEDDEGGDGRYRDTKGPADRLRSRQHQRQQQQQQRKSEAKRREPEELYDVVREEYLHSAWQPEQQQLRVETGREGGGGGWRGEGDDSPGPFRHLPSGSSPSSLTASPRRR